MKEYQKKFYGKVGEYLTKQMYQMRLNVAVISKASGQQYNTIRAAMEGRPFQFHQASWIREQLNLSVDRMIETIEAEISMENFHGEKETLNKEESKQEEGSQAQSFI